MMLRKSFLIHLITLSSVLVSQSAQSQSAQSFNLGIINSSSHTLTYAGVSPGKGSICSTFGEKQTISPGDGFVVTESMEGSVLLTCLYKFKTETGQAIHLQVINPTMFYNGIASYGFFDAHMNSLSTLFTPEKYPIHPRSLMHKSAVVSLNAF